MSVLIATDSNTLLSYAISTDPLPLQVSSADGADSFAALTVVASNGSDEVVYCNEIVLVISTGDTASDLTAGQDVQNIKVTSPAGWKQDESRSGKGTFVFVPTGSNEVTVEGLTFYLYNIRVNLQVGITMLTVNETASNDNINFTERSNTYELAKFPYQFFVGDFTAGTPQINNGDTVTLTWRGSDNAVYAILYHGQTVNVNNARMWQSPPLTLNTTFLLRATVQIQGETVDTYISTSVNVLNPDLQATTLTVLNTASVGSPAHPGTMVVSGSHSVNGYLYVKGKTTLSGGTAITSTATFDSLVVLGGLNVTGAAQFIADVSVGGTATLAVGRVLGDLIVDGKIINGQNVYTADAVGGRNAYIAGQGQLQQGKATVELTQQQQTALGSGTYRVMLTPLGACNGLYITGKTAAGFTVAETGKGTSDCNFDWLVMNEG